MCPNSHVMEQGASRAPLAKFVISTLVFQLFGILRLLGLGTMGCSGCSMNLSGTKRVWFVKRPTEHLQSEVLQTALKLKTEQYHTLTEEQIRAQQTTHQPEIRWTDLPLPATKQAIDRDG